MAISLSAVTCSSIGTAPQGGVSCFSSSLFSSRQRLTGVAPLPVTVNVLRSTRCGLAAEEVHHEEALSASSLYSLLGLDQHVGLADIKSAYRQMARKYHPDVCPESKREECIKLFLQVQDAYEILSDPDRRAEYDYHLMHPLSAQVYGLGHTVKNRRSTRGRDETVSEAWKMQWQAQLSRLQMKARMDQAQTASSSWGAQMRARAAQK